MTRYLLEWIYSVLTDIYYFLTSFWSNWSIYLSVIPIVQDIVYEALWLLYYICYEFHGIFYWWDYLRTDPTFINDFYNVLFFLRVGFEDYITLRGDPGNICRVVYYPAHLVYRFLYVLERSTFTLDQWYRLVITAINNIISWDVIKSNILVWLPRLEDAVTWVINSVTNVLATVGTWWDTTKTTVQGWIDIAKTAVLDIVAIVQQSLASLQTAWDNFKDKIPSLDEVILWWGDWWAAILKPLNTWWAERIKEVNTLIDSTLKTWFPFYDDLVKLWGDIKLFFTDPEEWLYRAADRIIERFW